MTIKEFWEKKTQDRSLADISEEEFSEYNDLLGVLYCARLTGYVRDGYDGNYFKDFMEKEEIFHERNVLRPEFVPSFLPHRDHQIQKVAEIVACTLKNSMPSNLFLFGKTGTGKTAVIKYVSEHLNQQCRESGIPESKWIFLNCQEVNTGYRVLAKICDEIDPKHPVPIAGWPIDVVFDALIEKISRFSFPPGKSVLPTEFANKVSPVIIKLSRAVNVKFINHIGGHCHNFACLVLCIAPQCSGSRVKFNPP